MSLTGDGIKEIRDLTRAGMEPKEINGLSFIPEGFRLVKKEMASTLKVKTLKAIADYINGNVDSSGRDDLTIHVLSHDVVDVLQPLTADTRQRETLIAASTSYPGFKFGAWMGQEEFVIGLQSMFEQDDAIKDIMKIAGSITDEAIKTSEDDGVTQRATAKMGISRVENVDVKGRHTLKPHRTFMEVDQPESTFIFRLRSGAGGGAPSMALFEADSGAWKLKAIEGIAKWLKNNIKEETTILS